MNLTRAREALIRSTAEPRICSIFFDGRSGSVFLQSLFDDHPDVITIPATVLIGPFTQLHINQYLVGAPDLTWNHVAERFPRDFRGAFDGSEDVHVTACRLDELGPNHDQVLHVSADRFREALLAITSGLPCVPRTIFLAIHIAWEIARRGDVSVHPLIIHAAHLPDNSMTPLATLFPDHKAIVMVREPKCTYASHFKHHIKQEGIRFPGHKFWRGGGHARYPMHILSMAARGQSTIGANFRHSNVRAVRLEDLHLNPDGTMRAVAQWLEIPYIESLISATFCGLLHWGDITIEYKNGPSYTGMRYDWQVDYDWTDALTIETMFLPRYLRFGYPAVFGRPLPSRPVIEFAVFQPMRWELTALAGWLEASEDYAKRELARFVERAPDARQVSADMSWPEVAVAKSYAMMCDRATQVNNYILQATCEREPQFAILR